MTVNIGKSIYEGISIVQFNELLKIASDIVPFGIYAIERKGVAIMLRKRYKSRKFISVIDAVRNLIVFPKA